MRKEEHTKIRLHYFSKATSIGPSSRYRLYQYLPYLDRVGIHTTVYPLFGPVYFSMLKWRFPLRAVGKLAYTVLCFLKRIVDLLSVGASELVVIEGELFPYFHPIVEKILARRHPILLELDDAIYLTPWHGRKIPALLRLSSGAIVGNATLAKYAGAYTPNVYVVPTVVDTDRFRPLDKAPRSPSTDAGRELVIVWIGLAFNFPYLERIVPALLKLQEEYWTALRVISSHPPVLPGVRIEFRPWSYENEVRDLQTSDIGVMPLIDDEWARGKCGLKLLQYMAVGLPAVASPVGVNRDFIRHGENGLCAETEEGWYRHLAALCRDSKLRKRIGGAARVTVESRYSLKGWGPVLAERYRTIIEEKKTDYPDLRIPHSVMPTPHLTNRRQG